MKDREEVSAVGWLAIFLLAAIAIGASVSAWTYLTSIYP